MTTAGDAFTWRGWNLFNFNLDTFGSIRQIARSAKADGGIIMSKGTDAIASTHDSFTWVVWFQDFGANSGF